MKVPILELRPTYVEIQEELDEAYRRVMDSGWYLLGAETEAFESEFASYVGTEHCVTVGNGLDAIRIALEAHGIGSGDEVLVPSHTFIATWLAVTQTGATPIGVDVLPDTANLDASLLSASLSPRTKAIIAVHLYGQPADMDAINGFAQENGLLVIEDSAQAHGARYKGKMCGNLGHSSAFSFYPGKNLGAFSDGGAITTNDGAVAARARMLRNYGSTKRYHHDCPGINSRIDEIQAAFLRVKLRHLDDWNSRRVRLAGQYLRELSGLESRFGLPAVPDWADPVWHLFVIRHPERDHLVQHLSDQGVQTGIHYPIPPHLSGAYAGLRKPKKAITGYPITERLANEVLSLPIGPHMLPEAVTTVVESIRSFP